jgi:hypothetical protein
MVESNVSRTKKITTVINSKCLTNLNNNIISPSVIYTSGNKNDDENHSPTIYHQNIHGLMGKIDEFVLSIVSERPHLICLSEHHLKSNKIKVAHVPNYKLGSNCCRTSLKCSVCIYIHKNMEYTNINLMKCCKEQDLEIVAVKLKLALKNVIVFCLYRAPGGNLVYFLNQLDSILNSLDNPKTEYILCGDLNMYNLIGTASLPTRITNTSFTAIDNIFVDKRSNYTIKPQINGLSDHDAQILTLKDLV